MTRHDRGKRVHYVDESAQPDLDDYFGQIVPEPPRTDCPGGVAFAAPFFDPPGLWFALVRRGDHVEQFEGPTKTVIDWLANQDAAEHWWYSTLLGEYRPLDDLPDGGPA